MLLLPLFAILTPRCLNMYVHITLHQIMCPPNASATYLLSITLHSCLQKSRFFSKGVKIKPSTSCNLEKKRDSSQFGDKSVWKEFCQHFINKHDPNALINWYSQYTAPPLYHCSIQHDFKYHTVKSWIPNYFQTREGTTP